METLLGRKRAGPLTYPHPNEGSRTPPRGLLHILPHARRMGPAGMGTVVKADAELLWAYAQYRWAHRPEHALPCCIGHIHALRPMRPMTEHLASTVYLHGHWPCIFVHVVATVVGVQLHEFYSEYTLDDGSGTIDVHCRQSLPTWHVHRPTTSYHPSGSSAYAYDVTSRLDHSVLQFGVGDLVDTLARLYVHAHRGRVLQAIAIGT